ncbi:MAG: hypothetical protein HY537_10435 [Deltaproteobacteria bacterium]|nr:hypothetical protein [Deltaproteobacteria bacterium]
MKHILLSSIAILAVIATSAQAGYRSLKCTSVDNRVTHKRFWSVGMTKGTEEWTFRDKPATLVGNMDVLTFKMKELPNQEKTVVVPDTEKGDLTTRHLTLHSWNTQVQGGETFVEKHRLTLKPAEGSELMPVTALFICETAGGI